MAYRGKKYKARTPILKVAATLHSDTVGDAATLTVDHALDLYYIEAIVTMRPF
jgi:hypothetical protein